MVTMIRPFVVCLWLCQTFLACRSEEASNGTYCEHILLYETISHKGLEGIYKKMPQTGHECANRPVYHKEEAQSEHFLYFINESRWQGWMVGVQYCINKGFLSISDLAEHPRYINNTWEEYNGFEWKPVKGLVFGCDEEVDYFPTKRKTTTKTPPATNNKTTTTAASTATTAATSTATTATTAAFTTASTTPQQGATRSAGVRHGVPETPLSATPGHIIILLYVLVPVGCLVLLILAAVVVCLYKKRPLPDFDIKKLEAKHEFSVSYNNGTSNARIVDELPDELPSDTTELSERLRAEGEYDFLDMYTSGNRSASGSFRAAQANGPPMYTRFGDKFGSWKGPAPDK